MPYVRSRSRSPLNLSSAAHVVGGGDSDYHGADRLLHGLGTRRPCHRDRDIDVEQCPRPSCHGDGSIGGHHLRDVGQSSNRCFNSESYATSPPTTADEPGRSVSRALTMPPVIDSAVPTV